MRHLRTQNRDLFENPLRIAALAGLMEAAACIGMNQLASSHSDYLSWFVRAAMIGAMGALVVFLGSGRWQPRRLATVLGYGITVLPGMWALMDQMDPFLDPYGPAGSALSGMIAAGVVGSFIAFIYNRFEDRMRSPRRLWDQLASYFYRLDLDVETQINAINPSMIGVFMVFEGTFVFFQVLQPEWVSSTTQPLYWAGIGFVSTLTAYSSLKIAEQILRRPLALLELTEPATVFRQAS